MIELRILVSLTLFFSQPSAAAQKKMDLETHDLLIQKLEGVLEGLSPSQEKWPVAARLADLYAERARLKFLAEQEKPCESCLGSKTDRRTALKHYEKILHQVPATNREKMMVQMAHLYHQNGESQQATRILKRAAEQKDSSALLKGTAETGLGETAFRQGDFSKAEKHFRQAAQNADTPNKGFVQYRLAWSLLNQGRQEEATKTLVKLLRNPEYLKESASFHEDVARDLATFLARGPVTEQSIQLLVELSPTHSRRAHLQYLGSECDRLGQRHGSLLVWQSFDQKFAADEVDRVDVQVRLAQVRLDNAEIRTALTHYQSAAERIANLTCVEEDLRCDDTRLRFKNFVSVWSKNSKQLQSPELLKAWGIYLQASPQDYESAFRAGQLAMKLENHGAAIQHFDQAVRAAEPELRGENRAKAEIAFEGGLMGLIEAAELKGQLADKIKAYDRYLKANSAGPSSQWVEYQKAYAYYQASQYKEAAPLFKDLALTSTDRKIRIQAADLALDTLVLLKQEAQVPLWANEFSKAIPERSKEYGNISRKAMFKEAERAIESKNASAQVADTYIRFKALSLAGASREQKLKYYKMRMLLAERLRDLDDLEFSAAKFLKTPGGLEEDRNFAWSRRSWVAELRLDFKAAYRFLAKMKISPEDRREHLMKLALLAELAGLDSRQHLTQALALTRGDRARNEIKLRLIRQSSKPWSMTFQALSDLKKTPRLLADIALENFGREADVRKADQILDIRGVRQTASGQTLSRAIELRRIEQERPKIASHRLNSKSDSKLQKSLRERMMLLTAVEGDLKRSAVRKDWTLQIFFLNRLARESLRFHDEILKLPRPKGLSAQQQSEYRQLLEVRAEPFKRKAHESQALANQLWEQEAPLQKIKADYLSANSHLKRLVVREMRLLATAHGKSKQLLAWLTEHEAPTGKAIEMARNSVRRNPFSAEPLITLKDLEQQRGRLIIAAYLDARAKKLSQGERSL